MSLIYQPPFLQTTNTGVVAFTHADTANSKKTLITAGAQGTKVVAINSASSDSSARIAQLWITRAATSYLLCSITVAITSGSDGATASTNLINPTIFPSLPVDNDGQPYLMLKSGDTLQLSFTTQITASDEIDTFAIGADF